MSEPTTQAYDAWLTKLEADGTTPPLAEYLQWAAFDANLPWRIEVGHLVNLLDAAIEALEGAYGTTNALQTALEAAIGAQDEGERT